MILYGLPVSTYTAKVRIALGVKGIDYALEPPPGGYSTPEYMKIVPLGTIPALKDGDFCSSESDVLIEYLDELHPELSLLPGSAAERAHQRFMAATTTSGSSPTNAVPSPMWIPRPALKPS